MASETQTAAAPQSASAPVIIKVAIVEDQRDIREGLASLIKFTDGYECTGSFRSMEEALEKIRFERPEIMLVDIGLPGMNGIEGIRLLKESYPELLLLMLTVYDDDEMIFDALCAGACGYLLKKTPPALLLDSLKEAMSGGAPMSPEVARRVIKLFREIRPPDRADYKLTPHELRLLKLLVEGRRRPQLQDGCGRFECQGYYHRVPHAQHLRETASAFQVRGRRQSAAQPPRLEKR